MEFPFTRLRRTRKHQAVRNLFAENHLSVSDMVYPIFVTEGKGVKDENK